jgi:hypothetical protein
MMIAWSFAAHMVDEVARLLRALGKHRYIKEVDHRVHFVVDMVLADLPAFKPHAAAFQARVEREKDLDVTSDDPSLWRSATTDEVISVLTAFWGAGEECEARIERLAEVLDAHGFELPEHEPWESDPEEAPFPELITLDWVLLPVDQLNPEHHKGAIEAISKTDAKFDRSAPIFQEGPTISAVELADGAPNGVLVGDFLVWSEEPYAYTDYVFRGASKAAKLISEPVGLRDLDQLDEFEGGDDDES